MALAAGWCWGQLWAGWVAKSWQNRQSQDVSVTLMENVMLKKRAAKVCSFNSSPYLVKLRAPEHVEVMGSQKPSINTFFLLLFSISPQVCSGKHCCSSHGNRVRFPENVFFVFLFFWPIWGSIPHCTQHSEHAGHSQLKNCHVDATTQMQI